MNKLLLSARLVVALAYSTHINYSEVATKIVLYDTLIFYLWHNCIVRLHVFVTVRLGELHCCKIHFYVGLMWSRFRHFGYWTISLARYADSGSVYCCLTVNTYN